MWPAARPGALLRAAEAEEPPSAPEHPVEGSGSDRRAPCSPARPPPRRWASSRSCSRQQLLKPVCTRARTASRCSRSLRPRAGLTAATGSPCRCSSREGDTAKAAAHVHARALTLILEERARLARKVAVVVALADEASRVAGSPGSGFLARQLFECEPIGSKCES
jgi:hypothetical protein